MINTQLKDQLEAAMKQKKIEVKYPDGYKQWKEKFDYFFGVTKSVRSTLDSIYGPGGGVDNYQGSIYRNSNLDIKKVVKTEIKKVQHKPQHSSKSFKFIKLRNGK